MNSNIQALAMISSYPLILMLFLFGIHLIVKLHIHKMIKNDGLATIALSSEAKAIHQRQYSGQIATLFSEEWFSEYWQGKRSPFYAFFTWIVWGNFIFFGLLSFSATFDFLSLPKEYFLSALIANGIVNLWRLYRIISGIMLWKAAKNSTTFWKYLSRVIAVLFIAL